MPGVGPQPTGHEASLCVRWNPVKTSSCPLLLFIIIVCAFEVRMFVRMKSVLLIIGCEFNTKDDETRQRKCDVREGEIVVRLLYHRDVCRNTKRQKEYVLNSGDKKQVRDLEKPCRKLGTEHYPSIIFVLQVEQPATVSIIAEPKKCQGIVRAELAILT